MPQSSGGGASTIVGDVNNMEGKGPGSVCSTCKGLLHDSETCEKSPVWWGPGSDLPRFDFFRGNVIGGDSSLTDEDEDEAAKSAHSTSFVSC